MRLNWNWLIHKLRFEEFFTCLIYKWFIYGEIILLFILNSLDKWEGDRLREIISAMQIYMALQ